jgi:hypothetical protein
VSERPRVGIKRWREWDVVRVSQHEMACNKSGEKARWREGAGGGARVKGAQDDGEAGPGSWVQALRRALGPLLRGCPVACPPPEGPKSRLL